MNKLSYTNNWESHEYKVDGKRVTQLSAVSIDGEKLKVSSFTDSRDYGDMGHTYNATSTEYTVTAKVFGAKIAVPIRELLAQKIKVVPVEFKVTEK
jgi:hypothetical protein